MKFDCNNKQGLIKSSFKFPPIWLTFVLFIFLSSIVQAQQPFQFWATYNNQSRLSNKWGYTFDLNYRTRGVLPFTSSLAAARVGVNYHLNPNIRITAGYAWFGTWVKDRYQIWLHENRIYEQIQYSKRLFNLQHVHRIRLEQRFRQGFQNITSDETQVYFSFRARYLFQLTGPLIKKAGTEQVTMAWQAANEIFFHWGENLYKNNFDQNRTLGGIVMYPGPKIDIAVLYQLILQRQPLLQETQAINSIRLIVHHNLDYRKK